MKKEVRCPECGYRMKTNECPICGKRVLIPVDAAPTRQYTQPRQAVPTRPATTFSEASKRRAQKKNLPAFLKAILIMIVILFVGVPMLFLAVGLAIEPEGYETLEAYQTGTTATADLPAIEAQTLYDDGQIKVTVDSYGLFYERQAVEFTVINNTDRNITVSADELQVNGYMLSDSVFYCEVQKGETAKGYLRLSVEDMELSGIETVAQIVSNLVIYDADDYTTITRDIPLDIRTNAYGLVQPVDDSGTVLIEENGIRLIYRGTQVTDYDYANVCFFYENLNDYPVSFYSETAAVNSKEAEAFLWNEMPPNTRRVELFFIPNVSGYGVEELADLKQIRLELEIQNQNTWESVFKTVTIPING